MECVIIKNDQRFYDYDLDVIAVVRYEEENYILTRIDVIPIVQTRTRFSEYEDPERYQFLVIPKAIVDVVPDLIILGEVYAEEGNNYWNPDGGIIKITVIDYLIKLFYLSYRK